MGRSRLRSSTTRAARRNRICRSSNSGVVQSKRLESLIRVLDEIGRDDSLRPCVERSSVEQEPERRKIRSAVPLGPCKRHRDVAEATHQFRLGVVVDQFQGSSQAHEFVGRPAAADPVDLSGHKPGLAFAREPARHPAQEDVFLALDAPTGKTQAAIVHPPQGVDTKVVPDNAEARAQQESSHDEPCLFVVRRTPSVVPPLLERRPKGAQQGPVPFTSGRREDALHTLEDRGSSNLVLLAGIGRLGEHDPDLPACRFQRVRRSVRFNRSVCLPRTAPPRARPRRLGRARAC